MTDHHQFQWEREPEAESLALRVLDDYLQGNSMIKELEEKMLSKTSTKLFDWVDHLVVHSSDHFENKLNQTGFESIYAAPSYRIFRHPKAQLPAIVLHDDPHVPKGVAIKVDYISDFLMAMGISAQIEGSFYSELRKCLVYQENHVALWAVERRATLLMEPVTKNLEYISQYLWAKEAWLTRLRDLDDEEKAINEALDLAEKIVEKIGKDLAAWVVLEAERRYYEVRNTAAQIQKSRQDRLGLGWANHDHHTFRSSRKHFAKLVRLFEILGFHCRERFYAGKQAGWGAQVMENPNCGLVLFLDTDLEPDEIDIDFAHHKLKETNHLGTVGLWCALHGDSILKAGMHHLECQFLFDKLCKDLEKQGIGHMQPFSNFSYLKQAFTKGEIWQVDKKRVQNLVDRGVIDMKEAEKILVEGALGSHLENLERKEGYKGFNKDNVSFIIKKTNPLKYQY